MDPETQATQDLWIVSPTDLLQGRIQAGTHYALQTPSIDAKVSPDGKRVLLFVTDTSRMRLTYPAWIVDLETGEIHWPEVNGYYPSGWTATGEMVLVQASSAPVVAAPSPPKADLPAPERPPSTGPWVKVTGLPDGTPVVDTMVWVAGVENMGRTDVQGRVQLMVPLPPGEQTLVVTPVDRTAYKESRYVVTVPAGAPEEYNLVVSPDRPLTFDHGQETDTPAFSPAPQRVSAGTIQESEQWRQVHAMRGAHSAWMDGEGQEDGFWEPFFVWTGSNPDHPIIETYLLNGGGRWHVAYDCPRSIGVLTITGIDDTGMLVTFTSTSGVTGTFHLVSHVWRFE